MNCGKERISFFCFLGMRELEMVPFAGYLLPVQYQTGVIKEHMAVRQAAGLFDVSHMGEILCEGPDALANLQRLLTNSFVNLTDGQAPCQSAEASDQQLRQPDGRPGPVQPHVQ